MPSKSRNDRHKGSGLSGPFGSGRSKSSEGQAATDTASDSQVEYIRDLQAQCGHDPLSDPEARLLTVAEASRMIRRLKADLPVPDPDACPDKWDADIWRLTLLFQQYARADKIELRASRRFIYMEIDDLVTRYTMRGRTYPQEVYGCKGRFIPEDMANHCWLHHPVRPPEDQKPGDLAWQQKVEVIMAEFWSRIWDEHALDHFRQHFAEYGLIAVRHWDNLRAARSADDRRHSRGRMPVGSKEG